MVLWLYKLCEMMNMNISLMWNSIDRQHYNTYNVYREAVLVDMQQHLPYLLDTVTNHLSVWLGRIKATWGESGNK